MKKASRYLILISAALIAVLLNVILFLTVPDGRTEAGVFWLAWTFAFPVNIIAFVLVFFWTGKRGANELVQMPIAYYISFVFAGIYLAVGAVLMYLPIKAFAFPVILLMSVSVVYIIVAMWAVLGAEYIMKNERYTKEKVMFIAFLRADIEDLAGRTADAALSAKLSALADAVRFSDPMSHPSLMGQESAISAKVAQVGELITKGNTESALSAVSEIERLLEERNRRCKILK